MAINDGKTFDPSKRVKETLGEDFVSDVENEAFESLGKTSKTTVRNNSICEKIRRIVFTVSVKWKQYKIYKSNKDFLKRNLKAITKWGTKSEVPMAYLLKSMIFRFERTKFLKEPDYKQGTILSFNMKECTGDFISAKNCIKKNYDIDNMSEITFEYLQLFYQVCTIFEGSLLDIKQMIESKYPRVDWDKLNMDKIDDICEDRLITLEKVIVEELEKLKTKNPEEEPVGSYL